MKRLVRCTYCGTDIFTSRPGFELRVLAGHYKNCEEYTTSQATKKRALNPMNVTCIDTFNLSEMQRQYEEVEGFFDVQDRHEEIDEEIMDTIQSERDFIYQSKFSDIHSKMAASNTILLFQYNLLSLYNKGPYAEVLRRSRCKHI
jgi:hypothetical protein